MCQEGDADWLTLDDYWDDVMPPKPAPAPSYSAYASLSGGAVHPALIREPTPVWKIVFGVLCFLWAAGGILWGANLLLAGSVAYALPLIALGVVWFIVGLKLTSRK